MTPRDPRKVLPAILPALYARVLGTAWGGLNPGLQGAFCGAGVRVRTGELDVRCEGGLAARLLARLLRLPPQGDAFVTRLTVTPERGGETWSRVIGSHKLVTFQRSLPGGLLVERFGFLELCFTLTASSGGLDFFQRGAALVFGPVRLRLPNWLAPQVDAREEPTGERSRSRLRVRISLPFLGSLTEYRGWMRLEDAGC